MACKILLLWKCLRQKSGNQGCCGYSTHQGITYLKEVQSYSQNFWPFVNIDDSYFTWILSKQFNMDRIFQTKFEAISLYLHWLRFHLNLKLKIFRGKAVSI